MILKCLFQIYIIFRMMIFIQSIMDENCEILDSEVHIIKDEYDEDGKLSRTCSGDILVSKCEGYCSSYVQPSVSSPTGFLKECFCCREDYLEERSIILKYCYDFDGIRIHDSKDATMEVKIKEPANCLCIKCRIV